MRTNQTVFSRFGQIGKGAALAGAIAALSLTTPTPAHAGNGVGAAIGLGILGGVIAGAAIANSGQPAYGYGYGYGIGGNHSYFTNGKKAKKSFFKRWVQKH